MTLIKRISQILITSTLVVTLAACTTRMPDVAQEPVSVVVGSENISFSQNQAALARIQSLDLNGQVGIITSQDRTSTTFTFSSLANGDYSVNLNIPYTARQASLKKVNARYFYSEGGKTYTANNEQEFSKALFGFAVPLTVLNKIVLGIPLDPSNAVVRGNVLASQVYDGNTLITYGDYRLLDNKYLVPFAISIQRESDSIRIRLLEPYTYVAN
ncbi:hypothetical protein CJP74_05360 [Psittacicella melopsittaci]|uniref:Outer-membrane lipoprotein LolB n=1 Tax=Psittacicella melopsittaci TaxID=2028576 RepID=A0A3A1Y3Q3_9GAMM|nr:lipoprotein insertase outer membrane protein LolB [Psittacicella melopsittaci]RIY32195.1 hypothetical protein CJP74_05360 [Psittacicella melopsittaci]